MPKPIGEAFTTFTIPPSRYCPTGEVRKEHITFYSFEEYEEFCKTTRQRFRTLRTLNIYYAPGHDLHVRAYF